jgi:NADPH:quinone reductase-like Zn-dependent oxidoreductase
VTAVANAVPDGSTVAIGTVRDGGHLATITQDPPDEQRGIGISPVIVEPDGLALGELAELVATGKLEVSTAATFPLEEAAEALAAAIGGGAGGAVVLRP